MANRDLQLGDKKVKLNHLACDFSLYWLVQIGILSNNLNQFLVSTHHSLGSKKHLSQAILSFYPLTVNVPNRCSGLTSRAPNKHLTPKISPNRTSHSPKTQPTPTNCQRIPDTPKQLKHNGIPAPENQLDDDAMYQLSFFFLFGQALRGRFFPNIFLAQDGRLETKVLPCVAAVCILLIAWSCLFWSKNKNRNFQELQKTHKIPNENL